MRSWWSASVDVPADLDRAILFRRFVEASRRAEIIALVNSARTDRDVARATVDELSEALEAEIALVAVARPAAGECGAIGAVGLRDAEAAAVAAHALCRAASRGDRAVVHAGEDLLGVGGRHAVLAPWTAEDGTDVLLGVVRQFDEPFDAAELALLEAVAAGVQALRRTGPLAELPWPLLSESRAALALVLLSGCWLAVSAPYEGRVLLVLARERGLTLGDLVVLPPLLLAVALVVKRVA